MAPEGQSDRMVSDMEVRMRCVTEFLHVKNMLKSFISADLRMAVKQWLWAHWGVGGAFQQWQWVTSAGEGVYKHKMEALVCNWWKCIANSGDYVEKESTLAENLLYQVALLCSLCLL